MSQSYQVIWKKQVIENSLASFVVQAMEHGASVQAITRSMEEIDRLLKVNPVSAGESRGEYQRVLIVSPLAAFYEVYEDERVAYVFQVRYTPRRQAD